MQQWQHINISNQLRNALADAGFTTPTPIQEEVFSPAMSGQNICGIAQTGTGKTIAYLLPALMLWKFSKEKNPQIIVIVPTRELVAQVVESVNLLGTYMHVKAVGVYGGVGMKRHELELKDGADIVVGTPGRLFDLLMVRAFKAKDVKRLIIDEVDEMLAQGFRHQLNAILDLMPNKRQNLLFSATMQSDVKVFIQDHFENMATVQVEKIGKPLLTITQMVYQVDNYTNKINLLKHLLAQENFEKVLVFASTKKMANRIYDSLLPILHQKLQVIHSNKEQTFRFRAIAEFESGMSTVLVSTDILARGIDVADITQVINFDVPDVQENYVHRIGRTGRADKKGQAITFCSEKEEEFLEAIEIFTEQKIKRIAIPTEIEITEELLNWEIDTSGHRELNAALPKLDADAGKAYHEKIAKNTKVNHKVTRADKMHAKYGKPITRGAKKPRK
jgi:ATP-dependent RNA helicase RhlE